MYLNRVIKEIKKTDTAIQSLHKVIWYANTPHHVHDLLVLNAKSQVPKILHFLCWLIMSNAIG